MSHPGSDPLKNYCIWLIHEFLLCIIFTQKRWLFLFISTWIKTKITNKPYWWVWRVKWRCSTFPYNFGFKNLKNRGDWKKTMETRRILKKFDLSVPWVTAWFICPMSYGLIYLSHELRLLIITLVFSTMADRFTENCD